jgi:hypothetical protein
MAIDTTQYVLVNAGTGDLLSDTTRITPELTGMQMYDMAGDQEAVAEYAETHGTELYAPGDLEGAVDATTLEGYQAVDPETGQVLSPSSLRLVDVAEFDQVDAEDNAAIQTLGARGIAPVVSDEVYDLEPLPFEDVNE